MNDKLWPKIGTPVAEGVALQVIKDDERKNYGLGKLVMPDTVRAKQEAVTALVVAVGPEVKQLKRGDLVLVHPDQPLYFIRWGGFELAMLTENRIGLVVDEAAIKEEDSREKEEKTCGNPFKV